MGNPGSVLHRMLRFGGHPVDPLDPLQNSVRLSNAGFYNDFGTFSRNWGPTFRQSRLQGSKSHVGHALTETAWIFSWALIKSLHSQSNPVRRYEQFYVLFVMSVMKLYMLQHVGHEIEYFPEFMSMIFLYFLDELRRF